MKTKTMKANPRALLGALMLSLCVLLGLTGPGRFHPVAQAALAQAGAPEQPPPTLDDRLAEVARRVPAFGGMYIGENRALHVYLLDTTQRAAAEAAIIEVFGRPRLPEGGIEVEQGQYSFLALKAWHDRHRLTTLTIPGVVTTSIRESKNRLQIGVDSASVMPAVERALAQFGVPRQAVDIVETPRVEFLQGLQDTQRPVLGGLQIDFGLGLCTTSFLAARAGAAGFVTCSHCTATRGVVDGTVYHQAVKNGVANRIGAEIADPPFIVNGPCPGGRLCRFSDTAFARRSHGLNQATPLMAGDFGHIATTPYNSVSPILTKFRIFDEVAFPLEGETLAKEGRTTGMTEGQVSDTCTDINVSDKNGNDSGITMLCQNRVQANSMPGDSGSPVFRWESSALQGGLPSAHLYGTLWGGTKAGGEFDFSSMGLIESELGALRTSIFDAPANSAPEARIITPLTNSNVGLGGFGIQLQGEGVDYEDANLTLKWTSDKEGALGGGTSIFHAFTIPGTQLITLTVTDSNGAFDVDTITLKVGANTPPTVKIITPTPGQTLYKGFQYFFDSSSFDPNEVGFSLDKNAMKWTSSNPGDPSHTGYQPSFTFSTLGQRTIKLTGTDSLGAMGTDSVVINVVNPPASGPPVVTISNPLNNNYLDPYKVVNLQGTAVDPDGKNPVSYKWVLQNSNITLGQGTVVNGQQIFQLISTPWKPSTNTIFHCGGYTVRIYLYATDADGMTGSAFVDVYLGYPPC
ncbi:MAG: hypothetical protein HYR56_34450 [Acidobacteria bacterium]|nr:hypothetical protein [Acidobacteriota bacterium]MBI3421652.1 hypothetical protein [Acidobacteriota bacterium]